MEPYPTDVFFSPTIFSETSTVEFSPLLSMQRYITVLQVVKDFNKCRKINNVTEFGCGSFIFFDRYLTRCDFITQVNQIDINRDRLLGAVHMLEAGQFNKPNIVKRRPLQVDVYVGNVGQKDDRVRNSDVVVAIEVIEHLFQQDLRLFPSTVFEFIKPKLVIVTTPNYDFNALFNNGGKFRDEDHKFEFTKLQFIEWATDIITKYSNYSVQFFGIGEAPSGCSQEIGYCTQMAIFKQKDFSETDFLLDSHANESRIQEYYLSNSYTYFTLIDDRTEEEKILQNISNLIINYSTDEECLLYIENEKCEWGGRFICLPLNLLSKNCKMKNIEDDYIYSLLSKSAEYSLKHFEEYGNVVVVIDECETYCQSHLN